MQINQSNLALLYRGFRVIYDAAFQAGEPKYGDIAMTTPSTGKEEQYNWLSALPGLRELIGEVNIQNISASEWLIKNKEWEDTIGVKEIDIECDTYGTYNPLFSALGQVAKQHPDLLVANLLINGFTSPCYTGKNFFDAGHAFNNSKYPFTNKHTYKLSANSFNDAKTNLRSRLNAQGRPLNLGKKLQLIVAPQNETLGKQILQADFIQQTAVNAGGDVVGAAAVSNVNKGDAQLVVWSELASNPNMWFLAEAGFVYKPFLFQLNLAPRLIALTSPDGDHMFKRHEALFQAYGRYNAGYGMPELCEGSTGATAAL